MKLWTNQTNSIHKVDDNMLYPRNTYVLPDELTGPTWDDSIPCPHKIKPYYKGRATGGATAVYRAGAIGDAIIATAFVHYLVQESGGVVDVYAPARNLPLYAGLGAKLWPLPCSLEAWDSYDAHLPTDDLFSGQVGNTKLGTGPGNCYQRIYEWIGVWDEKTMAKYCRPYLYLIDPDHEELKQLGKWPLPTPFFAYHVSSSGPTRTYPPKMGQDAVLALLEAHPHHHAVIIGLDNSNNFKVDHPRVIDLFNTTKQIRSLFPIIANADFVVAPDSSVNHIAAGLDTACVSLWGSYHPDDRMTYYPKNVSVFKPDTCPHAPCRPHAGLPQAKCKDASNKTKGTQYWCNALRNITAEDIVAASHKARELEDKQYQEKK
jgi:Glycosyltransferase family 9 (heptosyltransferase)